MVPRCLQIRSRMSLARVASKSWSMNPSRGHSERYVHIRSRVLSCFTPVLKIVLGTSRSSRSGLYERELTLSVQGPKQKGFGARTI